MDGLALIEHAQEAGLRLELVDGNLVMKGPRRLSTLVQLIANNKQAVVLALSADAPPRLLATSPSVGVTETPEIAANRGGFADRGHRKRNLPCPPPVPENIVADPIIPCGRQCGGRVLPELRRMTGGLCWRCWEKTQKWQVGN